MALIFFTHKYCFLSFRVFGLSSSSLSLFSQRFGRYILAFLRCLSNLGIFTELQTKSFIESTGVACSDSVSHNWVQVVTMTLSPVLANIYMEYFEEMALGSTSLKPSMWLRHVDDTFILWPHKENVQILLDHVKTIRLSIQVTMEKEQDNQLPFLDELETRTEQGFRSSMYRKPTFTGQYFNFNYYHPYTVKKGIVRCLQHRAKTTSSDTDTYQEEMIRLKHNLHRTNYPERIT